MNWDCPLIGQNSEPANTLEKVLGDFKTPFDYFKISKPLFKLKLDSI